jgi:uncharacterized membrane protein YfcA
MSLAGPGLISALVAGAVAGFLSGFLGIGGALITTPIIRVILRQPAYIALGTTVPLLLPTAALAAFRYSRDGHVDFRLAALAGSGAAVTAVLAGNETRVIPGEALMIATAVVMIALGAGMFSERAFVAVRKFTGRLAVSRDVLAVVSGIAAGAAAGFLGIGGGFVLVPAFSYVLQVDTRTAFGTSLAVIALVAVPSTIVHAMLGHVSWQLAAVLALSVVPFSYLGASAAARVPDAVARRLFSVFLVVVGIWFALFEAR